jgi:filamentous hemagglutinin family protein
MTDAAKGNSMTIRSTDNFRTALKSSASFGWVSSIGVGLLLALPLFASPALANPLSAAVTTGSASIATSSNKTQIDQKSEDVVIDWSSFNIGAGQTTQFVQPNAQAIAVNRIGGNSASQILGTLDANGRIVLINGNGMLFGRGSQVNVGSLVATSTGGADSDVLNGKFTQAGNQNAAVANQGRITASQGGLVALVAPSVTNSGIVNAKFGTVAVGAANKFTVDFSGDGLVSFAAQGDVNSRANAINTGLLSGANVSLTAHAAEGVATGVVTMSGIITAQTAKNVGGTILLDAGDGSLSMTGKLDAAGQTGGGKIETSGNQVAISGSVTAGKNGNWKVDPENLTINASAASTIDGALNAGTSVTEQPTSGAASGYGTQSPGAGDIIVASALSWNTSATLTLDSYHSIDVNAPITVVAGGGLVFKTNDGGTGGDYTFSNGAGITYPGGSGSGASFTLNGTPYTLLYSMSDVQNINSNLSGDCALANPLDASSVTGWIPIGNGSSGFAGVFAGLGNTISNLSVNQSEYAGLFGYVVSGASIRNFGLLNASVTGGDDVGGLVGYNAGGKIANTYVTGTVALQDEIGNSNAAVGGLVGYNDGTIAESYSTAAVNGNNADVRNTMYVGGLAGDNAGAIFASYANEAVTASAASNKGYANVGGLVGYNSGSVTDAYSAGIVAGTFRLNRASVGGFVGSSSGTITGSYSIDAVFGGEGFGSGATTDSYWDTQTSGQATSNGGIGVTTSQLLSKLPTGFDPSVWGTGHQLFPYFLWQYPNGTPQAISGLAFKDGGETILAPTTTSQPYVSALVDGQNVGQSDIYANGFYYLLLAPGTISGSGSGVLAYTTANSTSGATNAAVVDSATGTLTGVDIWGNTLIAPTSDTTYTLASATPLQTQDASLISEATGSNSAAQSLVAGLSYFGYIANGASFTLDEPLNLTNGLFVETTANDANITVADAVSQSAKDKIRLDATGNIAIDAGINTAGTVSLGSGGTITLAATIVGTSGVTLNSVGNIDVDKKIGSSAGIVTLTSGGTINETGAGVIDAKALTGSSVGGTTLNAANMIGTLDGFSNSGAGGFTLTDGEGLNVADAVNAGTGNMSLTDNSGISVNAPMSALTGNISLNGATSIAGSVTAGGTLTITGLQQIDAPISSTGTMTLSGGPIDIGASVTSGGVLVLTSTSTVTETGPGLISATTLSGSSVGGATLTGANQIANFDFAPGGGGNFSLTDDSNLNIESTIDAGTATLVDTGSITESTGAIDATKLRGSSVGGAAFNSANLIGTLGVFTNSGAGGIALTDGEKLVVGGTVNAGTGNLALTTTGAGSTISFNDKVTAGGTLVLNSSGAIGETATDVITAAGLSGSAVGTTNLKGANLIASLGNFTDSGSTFSLIDEEALTVSGTLNTGSHALSIQVTSGDLDLTGALKGNTVTLGSSTGEVYGAGTITANVLNVTANTGIDLTGPNDIGTIGTNHTNSGPDVINNP